MKSPEMENRSEKNYAVLILSPVGEDGAVLKDTLSKDGLECCICASIEELCQGISGGAGTALIAEEALSVQTIELLAGAIEQQPEWSDFPLLIMASQGIAPDRTWAILDSTQKPLNANILERPVLARTLVAAVRSALKLRESQYRVAEELIRRKETERSLLAANEELESFSYSVTHDLRSPLQVTKIFAEILLNECQETLNEECRDYLHQIHSGTERMGSIIDDLLALSRISRQETVYTQTDLSDMARASVRELAAAHPGRTVKAKIQDGLKARVDQRLMSVALGNLLSNAYKYSQKRDDPQVEFGAFEKDGERVYFVKDNGEGFDMQYAHKLFTPFKRLHSDKEFTGTGVGLAIVQRAIKRHGGKIWAEGEKGKGATFYFTLSEV